MAVADDTTIKTHLSLNVADVERSRAFYEAFFGVPAHKRRAGYANFDLAQPALKLALNQNPPERGKGTLNHLGLVVPSAKAVNDTKMRLEMSGLVTPTVSVGPIEQILGEARRHLGEAAYASAWSEGRAMSLSQATAYALGSGAAID